MSWEQPLNTESLLKAWLNSKQKKLDKTSKGEFGEALCKNLFTNHLGYSHRHSNYHTHYGELDLVFSSSCRSALALEVKLIFSEQEDGEIWSFSQRKRFLKSIHQYSICENVIVDYGLFLIKKDFVSFVSSQDLFI